MAAKIKCPGCGAKNDVNSRRCRVCTGILNLNIPEPGKGGSDPAPSAAEPEAPFDAGMINRDIRPAVERFKTGGSGLSARIAAAGSAPAGPPAREAPPSVEGPSWARVAPSEPAPDAWSGDEWSPPPIPGLDESPTFGPSLLDSALPSARSASPPPPEPNPSDEPFEPFDPDALFGEQSGGEFF